MDILNRLKKLLSAKKKGDSMKMKLATNFPELCTQTALWFLQIYKYYPYENELIDSMFNEDSRKNEIKKFLNFHTGARYSQFPDLKAELWLKNRSHDHGAIGYILDIIYIESDETSLISFPVILKDMPKDYPEETEKIMQVGAQEIWKVLSKDLTIETYIPLFGSHKSSEDPLENFKQFSKSYVSTLNPDSSKDDNE